MKNLPLIDSKATGIDVGSEHLHVSVGGGLPQVFGTMTRDIADLIAYVTEQGARSVAMEATGVYWMYLYEALQEAGFEVLVVNGRHVRNLPGRKTDMSDCQWLATLHAHGLLRSGFVPPEGIRQLQDYLRLREDHIRASAAHAQHMQKALERMNIKFHAVISDVTGASGLRVLRAIVAGERDPARLLALCDRQIAKRKSERVLESLRGTWKLQHLFALRQALEGWDFYKAQIRECDQAIEAVLSELSGPGDGDGDHRAAARRRIGRRPAGFAGGCAARGNRALHGVCPQRGDGVQPAGRCGVRCCQPADRRSPHSRWRPGPRRSRRRPSGT